MQKSIKEFKHNKLIKTHRCIQVLDIFDIHLNNYGSRGDRLSDTLKELNDKNIDFYTKTTIVYYLPKSDKL